MRKLFSSILELVARKRIKRLAGVLIAPDSKVKFRQMRLHPDARLQIGRGTIFEGIIYTERAGAQVQIGANTFIGSSKLVVAERIVIGDDVLIAWGCTLVDHNSHSLDWKYRQHDVHRWYVGRKEWTDVKVEPVVVKDRAWIGFDSIVLKGVTIGCGAIVGAGSVVTKDVSDYTVVAGNPARTVRELGPELR